MDRGGSRVDSFIVKGLRRVSSWKGQAIDGASRVGKPPLELRREIAGCRLETQVLMRAYELVVPLIRRSTTSTRCWREWENEQDCETQRKRVAQGA